MAIFVTVNNWALLLWEPENGKIEKTKQNNKTGLQKFTESQILVLHTYLKLSLRAWRSLLGLDSCPYPSGSQESQEFRIKQASMLIILSRHFRKPFIRIRMFLKWCLSAETFRFVLMTKKNEVKLIKQSPNFSFSKEIKHSIWEPDEESM